ncbi:MAG TPA: carboxypeptidase regulatory-like domain-containing protein [Terracidiphilus sp.]|nr:carboxypeptidase regulatory-like domain-containing protein [Terracidiphilus sp.]
MQHTHVKNTSGNRRRSGGLGVVHFNCLFVFLLAFFALSAHAQYGASMQGVVMDAQGAVIPGAHVMLTEQDTGRKAETNADAAGNFFFGGLAPSFYRIEVSHDGFKTNVIENFKVVADQANALDVKLEVGGTLATVTVNAADQPLLDTETANVGSTITQGEIAKLPSAGRDVFELVQLASGMFGDGSQSNGGSSSANGLPSSNSGGAGMTQGIYKTENQPQASANGGRTNTNGISIDGVAITSVTWGGAAVITPNEDTVKEFKVVANPYDAEDGRTSGADIKITSQNGTNAIHGSAFFKRDSGGLNAAPRWDPRGNAKGDKNNAQFNDFGGTVGGPILHNRLFGFFGYEAYRDNNTAYGGGWYETPYIDGQGASGSIATQLLTIKGAAPVYSKILESGTTNNCAAVNLVQGYNCNFIQGQGLAVGTPLVGSLGTMDPNYFGQVAGPSNTTFYAAGLGGNNVGTIPDPWNAAQQIADPGPNGANLGSNASLMFVQTAGPNNVDNAQYNARVDYQATSKDLIAGTMYYTPSDNTSYDGTSRAYNLFHSNVENYSIGALYDHTFNDHIINQARADMAGWRWNQIKSNPQEPLGLPDDNISGQEPAAVAPSWVSNPSSGGSVYGSATPNSFGPSVGSVFDQWTLNFKDVATWAHKTHNIKFGGNVTRLAYLDDITWAGGVVPSYTFNNIWDFLNDAPSTESITVNPLTGAPEPFRKDDRQMVYGLFVQDDWKLKPNLTVNLGLRWEYMPGMFEKYGHLYDVDLGSGSGLLTGLNIRTGGNEFSVPKGNFGPQVGFAWSPTKIGNREFGNKLVVHGGFGIGYDGLEQAITTNNRFNPPTVDNSTNTTQLWYQPWAQQIGNTAYLMYATGSSPYALSSFPANPSDVSTFNSAGLENGIAEGVTGFPSYMSTAYVYRYSFDSQYELPGLWVASLGYQGSTGHHLPIQINLLNALAQQLINGSVPVNPLVSNIDWYYDGGFSSYNALLGELKHQMAHGVELDAQYHFAKSTDNGSNPYAEPDYQFQPGYNTGPSDFDSRQMFKVFGLWAPTIFHGQNSMYEKLLGNWTLGGILNFHSGFPYDPTYGGIACNAVYPGSGDCGLRPATYLGGAGNSQSTDTFKSNNGNFSKITSGGSAAYFTAPAVVNNTGAWSPTVGPTLPLTPIPQAPGIERNAFVGPHYFDTDMTLTKAFVLPSMKVLGEDARVEFRANAYNLFNKLNLSNSGLDANIYDATFGQVNQSNGVLTGRTIEMEAHFKF